MSGLDSFFQPINEDNIFGDSWTQANMDLRKQFFNEKEKIFLSDEDGPSVVANDNEELKELDAIDEATQKAKRIFEVELVAYNALKDKDAEYTALSKLITDTFEDIIRKIEFATDAFKRRIKVSDEITDKLGIIDAMIIPKTTEVKDTMMSCLQVEEHAVKNDLKLSREKLKRLGSFYTFSKQMSLGHHCPICYHNEVDVFCDPCGHTYCHRCVKTTYCYICRQKINKTHKLFFT